MIALIVQARVGSTRLPRKVLTPIADKPLLSLVIERLKRAKKPDILAIATTQLPEDDQIEELARTMSVACFRGSANDVLDRYYQAASTLGAECIVRVTGDCPLHEGAVVDQVVDRFRSHEVDYTAGPSNYPEGLDTEVFRFDALERAAKRARLPSEREHVTLFIRKHPELFRLDEAWTAGPGDHSAYHWSVDTKEDLAFVRKVQENFGASSFTMQDVLELLEHRPDLLEINRGNTGFEGLQKSLAEDEIWKREHE